MPVYTVQGPQGEEYDIEAPDGATKEQAFEFFKREHSAGRVKPRAKDGFDNPLVGAGQAAASILSSGIMQPLGGIAGLVAAPFVGANKAADIVDKVSGLAYEPSVDTGKKYVENIGGMFNTAAEKLADVAPNVVAAVPFVGETLHNNLTSDPEIKRSVSRAMADVALNFLPIDVALAARGKGKPKAQAPKVERKEVVFDAPRVPEQMELPLETSPQSISEMQGRDSPQMDMFAPANEPTFHQFHGKEA